MILLASVIILQIQKGVQVSVCKSLAELMTYIIGALYNQKLVNAFATPMSNHLLFTNSQ